jgi:hypothetical protein
MKEVQKELELSKQFFEKGLSPSPREFLRWERCRWERCQALLFGMQVSVDDTRGNQDGESLRNVLPIIPARDKCLGNVPFAPSRYPRAVNLSGTFSPRSPGAVNAWETFPSRYPRAVHVSGTFLPRDRIKVLSARREVFREWLKLVV